MSHETQCDWATMKLQKPCYRGRWVHQVMQVPCDVESMAAWILEDLAMTVVIGPSCRGMEVIQVSHPPWEMGA